MHSLCCWINPPIGIVTADVIPAPISIVEKLHYAGHDASMLLRRPESSRADTSPETLPLDGEGVSLQA